MIRAKVKREFDENALISMLFRLYRYNSAGI